MGLQTGTTVIVIMTSRGAHAVNLINYDGSTIVYKDNQEIYYTNGDSNGIHFASAGQILAHYSK